jgi:hypothetical protein
MNTNQTLSMTRTRKNNCQRSRGLDRLPAQDRFMILIECRDEADQVGPALEESTARRLMDW